MQINLHIFWLFSFSEKVIYKIICFNTKFNFSGQIYFDKSFGKFQKIFKYFDHITDIDGVASPLTNNKFSSLLKYVLFQVWQNWQTVSRVENENMKSLRRRQQTTDIFFYQKSSPIANQSDPFYNRSTNLLFQCPIILCKSGFWQYQSG